MRKAFLGAAALALLTACGEPIDESAPADTAAAPPAAAPAAPPAPPATPGVARRQVGEAQVTTLLDGRFQFPAATLFQGIEPAEAGRLLQAGGEAAQGEGGVQWHATVSGFLVDVGGQRVLIDTGAGTMMPGGGGLVASLAAAGVTADSVQHVLITHFHGDHIGGLIDAAGKARFPNATVHAHADEIGFWTDTQRAAAAPAEMKGFFEGARRVAAAYGDKMQPFRSGEIVPGLAAEPAAGHTPGHTVYRLSSGGQDVFFIGDLMHAVSIQAPRPAVTLQFDTDAARARSVRQAFLARVAGGTALIAAPHFPFPGIGRFERAGAGYRFTPAEAAPARPAAATTGAAPATTAAAPAATAPARTAARPAT